jgi:hypothetical protein
MILAHAASAGDSQNLSLGPKAVLEAFFTPGHSQDSVCYRIGDLLLVGDLPFAVTPGIAGITGWSQTQLVDSLSFVMGLFKSGAASWALPGHGRALDLDKSIRVINHGLRRASSLNDLVHLNVERVLELQELSRALLDEASRAFAGLGGRLLRLNHYLEELGEPEAGRRAIEALDLDGMEKAVHDFHNFAETLAANSASNNASHLQYLAKAVQFSERGQRLLAPLLENGALAPRLARRTQRLLFDFVNYAQGVNFEAQATIVDIQEELLSIFQEINEESAPSQPLEQALFDAAHDGEAFCALLTNKIGELSLLNILRIGFLPDTGTGPLWVALETETFRDIIAATLELYAMAGAREVNVVLQPSAKTVLLGFVSDTPLEIPDSKRAYLQLSLRRLSGECAPSRAHSWDICFELPQAPAPDQNAII